MSIFVVIATGDNVGRLDQALVTLPVTHKLRQITKRTWLVATRRPITVREFSEAVINKTDYASGSFLAFRASAYYGHTSSDTWDWLQTYWRD